MPTYEYICKACGHDWTIEQRISEPASTECPKCHQPMAQRQISGGNFILKGGGWYADLYSSSSKKSDKKEGAATETKGDAKPEAKAESSKPADASTEPAKAPSTPAKSKD